MLSNKNSSYVYKYSEKTHKEISSHVTLQASLDLSITGRNFTLTLVKNFHVTAEFF